MSITNASTVMVDARAKTESSQRSRIRSEHKTTAAGRVRGRKHERKEDRGKNKDEETAARADTAPKTRRLFASFRARNVGFTWHICESIREPFLTLPRRPLSNDSPPCYPADRRDWECPVTVE